MDYHSQSEHASGRPSLPQSIRLMKCDRPVQIPVQYQKPQVEPVKITLAHSSPKAKANLNVRS